MLAPTLPGRRCLEQMLPEFFMVATAQLICQALEVLAALIVTFIQKRYGCTRDDALILKLAQLGKFKIYEPNRNFPAACIAQCDEFG
jgi:hypothetical protein